MADKEKEKAKVDLGLLEEDDEFEEFPAEGKKSKKIQKQNTMTNKNSKFNIRMGDKRRKRRRGGT
jgi:hypothetical protein